MLCDNTGTYRDRLLDNLPPIPIGSCRLLVSRWDPLAIIVMVNLWV